jgi:hypothetical protein
LNGTLALVNVLRSANWSGSTTQFRCPHPSARFKSTNPTLHGQIWVVSLRSFVYSEFRLDEGRVKTNQNGVCSFIRKQWPELPELPELLAVDAGAKTNHAGAVSKRNF